MPENCDVSFADKIETYLTEDGDHEDLGHAPAAAAGQEERAVVPPALVDAVKRDGVLHLLVLELDEGRVGVAVAVEADEESERLLVAAVGHEVPGRLGDDEDQEHDNDRADSLEDNRDLPLEVAAHVRAAEGDSRSRDRTTEPTAYQSARALERMCHSQL